MLRLSVRYPRQAWIDLSQQQAANPGHQCGWNLPEAARSDCPAATEAFELPLERSCKGQAGGTYPHPLL